MENESVEDAVGRFLDAERRNGLQKSTLDGYEYKLNNFVRHAPAGAMMRDVQPDHVHSYIHARVNEGQANESAPSNATVRSRYRHVQAFFSWAEENELVDESPVEEVSKPRTEEKEKAFLRPEDVEKLLRSIDAHREMKEGEPGPTPRDTWFRQMIRIAVGTGLRRGELLNLQWGDIDLDAGRVVVRNREGFTAKNGNERTVPLRVISEILGHSNTQVTEMYSHLSPEVMDRAMEETFGGS